MSRLHFHRIETCIMFYSQLHLINAMRYVCEISSNRNAWIMLMNNTLLAISKFYISIEYSKMLNIFRQWNSNPFSHFRIVVFFVFYKICSLNPTYQLFGIHCILNFITYISYLRGYVKESDQRRYRYYIYECRNECILNAIKKILRCKSCLSADLLLSCTTAKIPVACVSEVVKWVKGCTLSRRR